MFEQGAGQMNLYGAVKLAKEFRTDLDLQYRGFRNADGFEQQL